MRMPGAPRCFWGEALVRLPPDSARTRNVIVKMIASQKMNRPAVLNFFIVLALVPCARVIGILFHIEPQLTPCDSCRDGYCAGVSKKAKQNLWARGHIWTRKR